MPRSRSMSRRSRSLSRRSRSRSRSRSRLSPKPFSLSPLVAESSACIGKIDPITLDPITEDDLIEYTQVHEGHRKHFCFSKSALRQWAKINPIHPTTRVPLPTGVLEELFPPGSLPRVQSGEYKYFATCKINFNANSEYSLQDSYTPQVYTKGRTRREATESLFVWVNVWLTTNGLGRLILLHEEYNSLLNAQTYKFYNVFREQEGTVTISTHTNTNYGYRPLPEFGSGQESYLDRFPRFSL